MQGWRVFNTPLIWVKSGGMLPLPEHGPRRTYECILYAFRGDRKVTAVYNDVIVISPERETPHPAQKPMLLYYNLLMRSVRPGDKVLDPFCGSGTIFAAANKLQLTATGIELNPAFYALAVGRIKENL
jgi:site-specific DNA-methyltransferase (adenine-specific)